jgi:hypothetical protein
MSGSDASKVVANRDIGAAADLAKAHPHLAPLIENAAISQAFSRRERAAVRWKRLYEVFGRLGLVCVLLAMVAFDYQITIHPRPRETAWLAIASAVLGAAGLASQIFIVITGAKEKWNTERFFAERIRCLKFQAFGLVGRVASPAELKTTVESWTRGALASLQQESMGGRAAVLDFSPSEVAIPISEITPRTDMSLLEEASSIYDALRLEVQAQHFSAKYHRDIERARWPEVLSQLCFAGGAILATVEFLLAVWSNSSLSAKSGSWQDWLSFSTLLLFILSAIVAVYERGAAYQPEAERYLSYLREVRRIRLKHADTGAFMIRIKEMEEVALRELRDFTRDSLRSNYIF